MPAREHDLTYTGTCIEKDVLISNKHKQAGGQDLYLHNMINDAEQTHS